MKFREFFYLPRSDRQVFITLAVFTAVLMVAVVVLGRFEIGRGDAGKPMQGMDEPYRRTAKNRSHHHAPGSEEGFAEGDRGGYADAAPVRRAERFAFDPNTADSTALLRLGLQPWQVRNIYKYRAAGGIYRTKEDFARVYGLTQKEYRQLEPYIRISADYQPAALLVGEHPAAVPRDTLLFPRKLKEGETIDLNQCDTTLLKRVPGIGSYYARRIADYGRRLGGYVSIDQLGEIENLPAGVKRYFVVENAAPRKLQLNSLSLNTLRQHPYLNYYQARAILEHRRKYGQLKSLDDLRLLPDFTPDDLSRLAPYVAF